MAAVAGAGRNSVWLAGLAVRLTAAVSCAGLLCKAAQWLAARQAGVEFCRQAMLDAVWPPGARQASEDWRIAIGMRFARVWQKDGSWPTAVAAVAGQWPVPLGFGPWQAPRAAPALPAGMAAGRVCQRRMSARLADQAGLLQGLRRCGCAAGIGMVARLPGWAAVP
ncbi:hypothetical protein DLM_1496 [Aquitalea magnusonii]|uniref:Uncharacterized protein n=1 Tax=Aquitalea magnusonii TaxID=332411 RepID=A0A3G9GCD8_9NEIS|nr:hypothetical protein [Aquitalea magnusonii]BBF85115.1 hypothetical protein DLM_1496 [Aquitalea magnusonii]